MKAEAGSTVMCLQDGLPQSLQTEPTLLNLDFGLLAPGAESESSPVPQKYRGFGSRPVCNKPCQMNFFGFPVYLELWLRYTIVREACDSIMSKITMYVPWFI